MPSLAFCGLSDIGLNRTSNQDVWTAQPDLGFFALADGIGGRKGGDIAAQETILCLCKAMRQLDPLNRFIDLGPDYRNFQKNVCSDFSIQESMEPIAEREKMSQIPENFYGRVLAIELRNAIEQANSWVYQLGRERPACSGMGTTLCCLLWTEEIICYAHVGDSRIYRFKDAKLELLTRDHSLLAKWNAQKENLVPSLSDPSLPHRKNFDKDCCPPKNIITRAIGRAGGANPEIAVCSYQPGDLFLLCSDGLSDAVILSELQAILLNSSSLEIAAKAMIERAKNCGSSDNITVLMIQHGALLSRS